MPTTDPVRRLSPELRTSAYYFINFTSSGATVAYAGIWFASRGLSSGQIGIINAVPVLTMLVLNLFVGRLADRAADWRQVIVAGAVIGALVPFALFFVNGFWGILIVWTLTVLPPSAIGPVADAASLRMTKRNGTDFGTIRAWGTVGFMIFNAVTGFVVSWFGSLIFVPFFILLSMLRGVASLGLPRFRAPARVPILPGAASQPAPGRLLEVMKPWFLLPLLAFAIIAGTHYILNAFAALLWKEQGISESVIGPLIALAAFAEAAMMFAWRRFAGSFSARNVILLSAFASGVRWTAMAFSPPVYVLILLQLLQSLSYALGYLGAMHFVTKWTSEDIAAEAQSLFMVLQQGMSVISLIGFGWLTSLIGAHAYFVAAGFALVGAGCVWLSLRLKQPVAG